MLGVARTIAMGVTWGVALGLAPAAAHGCGATVFECSTSADCTDERSEGTCQPDGWCSFADPTCASGQRYGDRAPAGIAGECVEPLGDTTTGLAGTDDPVTSNTTVTSTTGASAEATADTTSLTTTTTTTATADTGTSDTGDVSVCGDGVIEGDEECDGDAGGVEGICTDDCRVNVCGDGFVGGDEECDSTPGCDMCKLPTCGDGNLDPSEECDGMNFGGLDCSSFGFSEGGLQCSGCEISTTDCQDCMMGCRPTCASSVDCARNSSCVIPASEKLGECWPACMEDADCQFVLMGAQCYLLDDPACLVPCGPNNDCPDGLACSPLENMGFACV